MKEMKRFLSFVLCLVMVLGLVPAGAITAKAAGDTIYILAGGDFQEAGDHANSAANVTNILAQVSQKYTTMDGFLFIGDYDCETHDSATETANGITALMGAVQGSYSNLNDANSVLAQGNHDYMDSRIDATGGHEFEGYSAYVLNEDDYPNGGGSQSGIQTLANNLKTWLNNKIGEGYSAPIFIVSHLPLAFTPRTVTQGDAKYAKYIFDVLNDAGANGLNIIFLHGHDHAYGPDNYMGGEAIYLPKGDKICIAEAGSTSKWTEEILNFTYMNAGYTGYYSDPYTYVTTAGTDKLTMTVFAITGSEVTVERYSEDGLYNLKSAGYDGSYSNTSVTNTSLGLPKYEKVYASPQTIALAENELAGEATIGNWVGVTAESIDDVTTSGNDWTTITAPTGGTTTYTYTQADSITAGEKYVIVGNSNAVALMDNDGSMDPQTVTVSGSTMTSTTELTEWTFSGSSSGTIYNGTRYLRYNNSSFSLSTNSSTTFTITDNGSNFRIQSGNYSFYYNGSSWTRSGRNTAQYVRLYQLTDTTTTGGTAGLYGKLDGELTYNVAAGTSAEDALAAVKEGITVKYATASDYSDEAEFADDGEGMRWVLDPNYDPNVPGDYAVTIAYNGVTLGTAEVVVPASTTYYVAEGNGLYLVDMNTSADDALAAVKAGITVYSATDANGTGKTVVSDDDVTWKWVDTYNGSNSGPYTVEILKDGTSLGTVEVKVNVKYETGINSDWTYIGESEATGGTYTYTLDTDGIDSDGQYIIVAESQALALHTSGSSAATAVSVNISSDGKTLTTTTRDYEYYWNSTYGFTRGSYGLNQSGYSIYLGEKSASYLDGVINNGDGTYCLYDNEGTKRTLYYNGSKFTVSEESNYTDVSVRLYKYTGMTGGTSAGSIYAKIEGNTVYTVDQGTSATAAMAAVKAGITGYSSNNADGSDATELDDSKLTWKWKNTYASMVTGSYWVEISYNGVVLGTVEVKVEPGVINNYPEYPNEGSVKVSKTGTGIDFQSSGIAQVEISASGVPIKKGADVIVMLDTSSSMNTYKVTGSTKTRLTVLEESMEDLVAQFQTPGDDGEPLDLRVAIADFNGFNGYGGTSGTPYDRDEDDRLSDQISYTANGNQAQIYTGTKSLTAGAFIDAADLETDWVGTLTYASGTNYDYAMDAIYQLGTAIKAENEANGEDRDLYVIFMTDGAAMQWNYYHSNGASSNWQYWLTGAWSTDEISSKLDCTEHYYYYAADVDGDGYVNEHRMADAIKGDPSETYEVIRKTSDMGTAVSGYENLYMVPGLGATMFAIAFDPTTDQNTPPEAMTESVKTIASDQTGTTQYYYEVTSAEQLSSAFATIGSEIAYAAYNARFVDQMGDDYNLQMKTSTYTVVDGDTTTTKTLAPVIEILTYDIYTRQDYLDNTITEDKIGDRKGTSTLNEVVKFSDDGTKAYSNLIDVDGDGTYGVTVNSDGTYTISDTDDNIIGTDGVIYAKTFLYNTNATNVTITGVEIPTGTKSDGTTTGTTNVLPSETFYWKMDTIKTSELAMRYYVYLEGSMEGTREGGSYPTNEYATLYYDNYLGNPCYKDTVSPVMAWKEANVSYAFYLVDENGNIIVNQTTGQTGSFANKIAVTNPVVYETIKLNNLDTVSSIEVESLGVLPEGYELYDGDAVYTIRINSNTTGNWQIVKGDDKVASTYVMQYDSDDASAYSNALLDGVDENGETVVTGHDYTHTVVWFAVLWKVQALPDTVVIDYGLPVDISVLTNDMFGENGKLAGVGAYSDSVNLDGRDSTLASGFGSSYDGTYGVAATDTTTGKVRYTLNTSNGMQMQTYEKFAYAVNYTGTTNPGYYYDTVTVIPATTIYYEDSFLTYTASGTTWEDEGTAVSGATQAEDRPGQYSLTDANNIYGYDAVNNGMSTFSLGTSKKVHVGPLTDGSASSATATFTFYGTGYDIISMTSNTTGVLAVKLSAAEDIVVNGETVYASGAKVKNTVVDTYYGYNYVNGEWVPAPDVNKAMYQVPVLQANDLPYGKYTVTLIATYMEAMDDTTADGYDLYIDAVRIYDPANDGAADGTTDTTIEDAYKADGEGWPSYIELRNKLISTETLGNAATDTKITGLVFIDGDKEVGDAQINDYVSYGPNNEVYLAPGQSVAFILSTPSNIKNVHIGIKSADGTTGTYTITNIAKATNSETGVKAGDYYGAKTSTISTTTDMYYDITGYKNDIIVISNTGDDYKTTGVISITNIKSTYTSDPNADPNTGIMTTSLDELDETTETEVTAANETTIYMTASAATLTLRSLNYVEETPEATEPEETEPETTEPEETEPETTVPEETEPETTEPEETETETTEPETEETQPSETEGSDSGSSDEDSGNTLVKIIKKLLGWLFG